MKKIILAALGVAGAAVFVRKSQQAQEERAIWAEATDSI